MNTSYKELKKSRLGQINKNRFGTQMKIINYQSSNNVKVKFLDNHGYETITSYQSFKNGSVQNPYDRSVFGVGYLGAGDFVVKRRNGKLDDCYNMWNGMLQRCYSGYERYNPAYSECSVCEEWHNFQNFAMWFQENFYKVDGERMHLDKDILCENNKIYSPDKCLVVPQSINMIFMTYKRTIDEDLPTGINRRGLNYQAAYNGKTIGVYSSLDEAIGAYKNEKIIHIKEVAEKYKDVISEKVYMILVNYKI